MMRWQTDVLQSVTYVANMSTRTRKRTKRLMDTYLRGFLVGSVITALFVPITNMENKTRAATSLRLRLYYCYHDGNYTITREPAKYLRSTCVYTIFGIVRNWFPGQIKCKYESVTDKNYLSLYSCSNWVPTYVQIGNLKTIFQ